MLTSRPVDRDLDAPRTRLALAGAGVTLAVCLAIALWLDGFVAHGVSVRWYTTHAGARTLVTRTVEHRAAFPNVHRPLARYVQGWPFERIPLPAELPAIDAELSARVVVPPGLPRRIEADSPNDVEVLIDGRDQPATSGAHDLLVRWRGRTSRSPDSAKLELRWGGPIPAGALTPAGDNPDRVYYWAAAGALSLALCLALFFAIRTPSDRRRRAILLGIATSAVLALGAAYRLYDYDVMPEFRENADELFATWNGWSLLSDGTTRGWSMWPYEYGGLVEIESVRFFGERREVISPYFEHPPLWHLLVGAAAHLGGAEHWLEAKLAHTRLVAIALGLLSLWLVIALGRRLWPAGPAPWLAGLLYAVLPTIALASRVIKEEALLTPLMLGSMLFFLRWRDGGKRPRELVLASVCAGLCAATKVPGVVLVPALVMLVAAERGQTKRALLAAAIGLGLSSAFFVFGGVIDWEAFVATTSKQGTRPTHWNLFPRWFDVTLINHNIIGRGWLLFLWLGSLWAFAKRSWRDVAVIAAPLVCYLVAISIGSGNWTFGWYIAPILPLVCLGAGGYLAELWERPSLLAGFLFVVLLVYYSLNFTLDVHWAKQPPSWPPIRKMVTLTTAAFLAPYGLAQVWRHNALFKSLARLATAIGLALVVVLSGLFVARYDVVFERYRNFDRDAYFDR